MEIIQPQKKQVKPMIKASPVLSTPLVNMDYIKQIESAGNPLAYNKDSKARGLYQITPIVLEEWNNFNPKMRYKLDDLFTPEVNQRISQWYLTKRIPQMLKAYKKPLTLDNILTSYNAGIGYVTSGDKLPQETIDYIRKYRDMLKGKR